MAGWAPIAWVWEVRARPWKNLPPATWGAFAAGAVLLLVALLLDTDGFIPILDHANWAFHEAGHLFFGIFGDTMHVLGGTLGQFVFPLIVIVTFWIRRDPVGVGTGFVWLAENLRYVATYMADARAQLLPLPRGTLHDWTTLFTRWGVLRHDTAIASVVNTLSWVGMAAACAWVAWRYFRGRRNVV
jgi:hypothetical protein